MYTETLIAEAWILSNRMNLAFTVTEYCLARQILRPKMLLCQAILLISLADACGISKQPSDRPAGQRKKRFGGYWHFSHQTDACYFSDTYARSSGWFYEDRKTCNSAKYQIL